MASVGVGLGDEGEEVGAGAVGDEQLAAGDAPRSPSRTARVEIAATSEPASGSVIAMAAILVPAIAGRRYRSFWSSVPNCSMEGVAMSVWTDSAIASAPQPAFASSSTKTSSAARSPPAPPHRSG